MTGTRVSTLSDFLLARIAEDEADARAAATDMSARWRTDELATNVTGEAGIYVAVGPWDCSIGPSARHIARHDPARVLAECEVKRQIVELHPVEKVHGEAGCMTCNYTDDWGVGPTGPCDTLRLLALPYADHPDYREAWRP